MLRLPWRSAARPKAGLTANWPPRNMVFSPSGQSTGSFNTSL